MKERPVRSIVKTLTWRLIAVTATVLAVYMYGKDLKAALTVGISVNFVKMFLYYLHERIWNHISFGRYVPKQPEYTI